MLDIKLPCFNAKPDYFDYEETFELVNYLIC